MHAVAVVDYGMPFCVAVPRLLGLLVCTLVACGQQQGPRTPSGPRIALSLPTSDGGHDVVPIATASATVVEFFSPSCEPCSHKVPMFVAQEAALHARGARLVLVAILADGETIAGTNAALRRWGVPHPFLVDERNVSRDVAGITLLPAALVLDPHGRILLRGSSTLTAAELLGAIPH